MNNSSLRAHYAPLSYFLRKFSLHLFTAVPTFILFTEHVGEIRAIDGPSMIPIFNPHYNDTLRRNMVLNWRWGVQEGIRRGMIVTFRNPFDPNKIAVKRVVALEGDLVRTRPPYPIPTVRIPEGHIWVEGDGTKTLDSNTYGPISVRLVRGRTTHVLWPLSEASRVRWWEWREPNNTS